MATRVPQRRAGAGRRPSRPPAAWRIAVVTNFDQLIWQRVLDGVYQRASRTPGVTLKSFDDEAQDFRRTVLPQLQAWRPQGLIIRTPVVERLKLLRRTFPGIPMVSTVALPEGLADVFIALDPFDLFTVTRHFFHKCGLAHVCLFTNALEDVAARLVARFRQTVPDGHELICPWDVFHDATPAGRRRRDRMIAKGLRSLPKPVGIVSGDTEVGELLLESCRSLGLRVPDDVQIIVVDQEDRCLACNPHLSSIELPLRRIGRVAVDTMLQLLRGTQPAPPPAIRVGGSRVVARGTTRPLSVGSSAAADAIDLMRTHATKGVTAGEVVERMSVSRATLYRTFAATTGTTPGRHLRQLRLEDACRLLRETDDTVTAIAEGCGFTNTSAFLNFFRRGLGTTPTAYRSTSRSAARVGKPTRAPRRTRRRGRS